MNPRIADYQPSMPALRRLGIAVLISGAALGAATHFQQRALFALGEAQSALASLHERSLRLALTREAQRAYRNRFTELRDKGAIDGLSPLAWMEAVKGAVKELGLNTVTFELEPAAPFRVDHPRVSAPVVGSAMTLHLKLRHEGELVRFLERLDATTNGVMWVRHCAIERSSPRVGDLIPATDNLDATCRITWLTVSTGKDSQPEETR